MTPSVPYFDELRGVNWQTDLDNGHTLHFSPGLIVLEQPDRARADVYLDGARRPNENDLSRAFKRNSYGPPSTCSKVFAAAHDHGLSWTPKALPLHVVVHLPSGDVRERKRVDDAWLEVRRRFMAMAFQPAVDGGAR